VGIASKLSFAIPVLLLYGGGQLGSEMLIFALIDLALAAMFLFFFLRLPANRVS